MSDKRNADIVGQPTRVETSKTAKASARVRDRITGRYGTIVGTYGFGRQKRYLVALDLPLGQASRRPADDVYRAVFDVVTVSG